MKKMIVFVFILALATLTWQPAMACPGEGGCNNCVKNPGQQTGQDGEKDKDFKPCCARTPKSPCDVQQENDMVCPKPSCCKRP